MLNHSTIHTNLETTHSVHPYRGGKDACARQQFGHAQVPNLDGLLARDFVLVDEDVGGLDVPICSCRWCVCAEVMRQEAWGLEERASNQWRVLPLIRLSLSLSPFPYQ